MHDGKKIAGIRRMMDGKQTCMAKDVGIPQQTLSYIERTGKISPKQWIAIEQMLQMKKVQIQAMSEDDFKLPQSGDQHNNNNVVFSYIMNFNLNSIDAEGIEQLKALLDHAMSLQMKKDANNH